MYTQYTQELKDEIKAIIKDEELYTTYSESLDNTDDEIFLSILRTWFPPDDYLDNWDTGYEFDSIVNMVADSIKDKCTPEFLESDEFTDALREDIWEHCTNDPFPDLMKNTRDINLVHLVGYISDIDLPEEVEDSEEFWWGDLDTFRVWMMFGRTVEEMIEMFRAEDWELSFKWNRYYEIVSNSFGYDKVCVAYQISVTQMSKLSREFNNGDIVSLVDWDVGIIDNIDWSGWMHTNKLANLQFTFDINQTYPDQCMGRYGYYSDVCWGTADEWFIKLITPIEVPTVTEDPLQARRDLEAMYDKVYRAGGCTFGDTMITRHRDTPYRNEYPCGNTCTRCWQFWID